MDPWQSLQSWGVVLVLVGGYYVYSTGGKPFKRNNAPAAPAQENKVAKPGRQRSDGKSKRKEETSTVAAALQPVKDVVSEASASVAGSKAKSKPKPKDKKGRTMQAPSKPEPKPVEQSQITPNEDSKEESGDKDWAQRLAGLKTGTSLKAPERKEGRSKTVKQNAANATPSTSQANGITAKSSAVDFTPSGKDVSDMLPEAAPGPSSIRITEPTNPAPAKKQQQPKQAPPPQETKKQRQNRRKVEEKRLQKEQDEKERRVLLEKQLRSARENRGEPAKNGLQPAKAQSSAWSQSNGTSQATTGSNDAQLLDTFENDAVSTTSSSNAPNSNASTNTTGKNLNEMPSEDEQLRMAMEETSWNTVSTRRPRKKTSGSDTTADDNASVAAQTEDKSVKQPTISAPTFTRNAEPIGVPSIYDVVSNPDDSEWSVV